MNEFGFPYRFEGPLDRFGVGRERKVWYNVLFLPAAWESVLPFESFPRLRAEGEIAGLPFEGAWIPTGDGRRYVIVAPRIRREAEIKIGDLIEMRFRIADQDAVDLPAELSAALQSYVDSAYAWDALTPGKRRAHAHRVQGAKGLATRTRRVSEVIAMIAGRG